MSAIPNGPVHSPREFPQGRSSTWRLRTRVLQLPPRPLVMGIVNATPDSFSDGGQFSTPRQIADFALRLEDQGADILDIGGESTRPFSHPVSEDEELSRVLPVIEMLGEKCRVPISIDTAKPKVASEALARGAEIINDVTALRGDRIDSTVKNPTKDQIRAALASSPMLALAIQTGAGVCIMHMQGTPQSMQVSPQYADVVVEVLEFLRTIVQESVRAGLSIDSIAIDPGIGFGKSHRHNLELLANCHRLHEIGCPLLVGHSRKGFISKLLGGTSPDRTAGTIGAAMSLARQGVQIIRVHDVGAVSSALKLFEASGGITGDAVVPQDWS